MTGPLRLTGRIRVARPPAEAFRLFTARGEQDWAPAGSRTSPLRLRTTPSRAPCSRPAPTASRTVWVVTDRQPGRRISYAQVTPGDRAGTVTVTLSPAGQRGEASDVEVTYQLTALSEAAQPGLREFADGYLAYLQSWQDAISGCAGDGWLIRLRAWESRSGAEASSQLMRGSRRNQDSWRRAKRRVARTVSARAWSRVHSPARWRSSCW